MLNRSQSSLRHLVGVVALVVVASGCRIVVPSVEEQKYLAAQGAFAGGAPAWVSTHVRPSESSSGLIPESYSSPNSIRGDLASDRLVEQEQQQVVAGAVAPQSDEKPVPTSPLDRIAAVCPGIDKAVNDALTTVELEQRIAQYSNLTVQCSGSSDLWIWLGNDYLKANQIPQAKRAFDQALIVEPTNADAKNGIDEVNRRLSTPSPAM